MTKSNKNSVNPFAYAIAVLGVCLILVACSIHKIDVQQGNVITQEMMEKLKIGMEKKKVSGLLGAPLIEDPFHQGRWDYVYKFTSGKTGEVQSSHITLYFDGEILDRINVIKAPPPESELKKSSLTLR